MPAVAGVELGLSTPKGDSDSRDGSERPQEDEGWG